MADNEKKVESTLVSLVKLNGGMCIKMLGLIGLPDRLCLFPGAKLVFVELKTTGLEPRKSQILMITKLRKLGFSVEVIDSVKGVVEFVDKIVKL